MAYLIIAVLVFGLCYLCDKAFTKAFRSNQLHKSGLAVRLSKRYGAFGAILCVLGIIAILSGVTEGAVLTVGGILVLLFGIGLIVYYASFGIFYDADTFLLTTFGKKSTEYHFRDIRGQKLYLIQGGSVVVELHMKDGRSVTLQSTMEGTYAFLDIAFAGWCRQTGTAADACDFYDPAQHRWFPDVEAD